MSDPIAFLQTIERPGLTMLDRARGLLWLSGRHDHTVGLTTRDILNRIEQAGHARQNGSRLEAQLSADKRLVVHVPGSSAWRLTPRGMTDLDLLYESVAAIPRKLRLTHSVLPQSLFSNTRSYIEKVVVQINGTYDAGFYDGCAVMCRRLLETLLIELYESVGRADEIKADGNYRMFGDLLKIFEKDTFHISRNARRGLQDFKVIGDLSAHNRRYNARKEDIDRIRDGLRVASEELLHLATLS